MRPGALLIFLLLVTLLARSAFAASSDFCTMPANQPAPVGLFQGEHAHLNHAQLEHDAMQHGAGEVQDRYDCCDTDCMMSGCLSMMPPVAHFASPIHAGFHRNCFSCARLPAIAQFSSIKTSDRLIDR